MGQLLNIVLRAFHYSISIYPAFSLHLVPFMEVDKTDTELTLIESGDLEERDDKHLAGKDTLYKAK